MTTWCMIMQMDSISHSQGPQCAVIVVWPSKRDMEHNHSGAVSDVINGILGGAILVMCSNSTQANCLRVLLELLGEFLGGVNSIVSIILLDFYSNSGCLPLKSNFRFDSFNGGENELVLDVHVGARGITKDSSTLVGQL